MERFGCMIQDREGSYADHHLMTAKEIAKVIQTGNFEGKKIAAIRYGYHPKIHDFVLQRMGLPHIR